MGRPGPQLAHCILSGNVSEKGCVGIGRESEIVHSSHWVIYNMCIPSGQTSGHAYVHTRTLHAHSHTNIHTNIHTHICTHTYQLSDVHTSVGSSRDRIIACRKWIWHSLTKPGVPSSKPNIFGSTLKYNEIDSPNKKYR